MNMPPNFVARGEYVTKLARSVEPEMFPFVLGHSECAAAKILY